VARRSVEAAQAFVEAVNMRSVDRLAELIAEDHVFIDSDGAECQGKSRMISGWADYFAMVPDYKITVRETLAEGGTVLMAGEAEGTFAHDGALKPENHWKVPAAWRVIVKNGKVAVWQLYANPESMVSILRRIKGDR
jgi:ketosteroid isomerase-like protein